MPRRPKVPGLKWVRLPVQIPSDWRQALYRLARPGDVSVYVRQRLYEALTAAGEQVSNPDGGPR